MGTLRLATSVLILSLCVAGTAKAQEEVTVRFRVTDGAAGEQPLLGVLIVIRDAEGAEVRAGSTSKKVPEFETRLPRGTYLVTYERSNYLPKREVRTEVRDEGQVITVSLSPRLEGEEPTPVEDWIGYVTYPCSFLFFVVVAVIAYLKTRR